MPERVDGDRGRRALSRRQFRGRRRVRCRVVGRVRRASRRIHSGEVDGGGAGRLGPGCRRARDLPDDGEPVVRPLLRHLPGRAGLRRPPRRRPRAVLPGLSGQHQQRSDRQAAPVPSGHGRAPTWPTARSTSPTTGGRSTPAATAARWTRSSGSTPARRMRVPSQGTLTMGYYTPSRPALLLRPGRRLHPVRRVPLLGHGPDPSESADADVGHARPRRPAGGPVVMTNGSHRRTVQRALGHHARGPGGRRRELEVLQPARRTALQHRHHAARSG